MNPKVARTGFTILFGAVCVAAMISAARAGGLPEPGITMYGKVLAYDGSLVTQGRLVWTFEPYGGSDPLRVQVSTDLYPLGDGAGTTYSYCIHIPAEMPVAGKTLTPNRLPVTTSLVVYSREATLDGGFATVASTRMTTATFGQSECGKIERVDLYSGLNGPPDVPSGPMPAHGATLVPLDVSPSWAPCARANVFDVFLWESIYPKPATPALRNLSTLKFNLPFALRSHTQYSWQVVARNGLGSTAGPEWSFRTAFQGDIQKLLEYLLGKRDLTFAERAILDLNQDGDLDIADLVKALKFTQYSSLRGLGSLESEPLSIPPEPRRLALGTVYVEVDRPTVSVEMPGYVLPNTDGVAGFNLNMLSNSREIALRNCRLYQSVVGEFLYYHSPSPGVTNIVCFTQPVQLLRPGAITMFVLDLQATLPTTSPGSRLQLRAGKMSDVAGLSLPDIVLRDGYVLPRDGRTPADHWELYR